MIAPAGDPSPARFGGGRTLITNCSIVLWKEQRVNSSQGVVTMEHENKSGSWASWPDLTELRRSRKISVAQIAALTKIKPDYLTAIEQGEFEKLPGGVYTTSYIRQYARAIDFPEHDLLLRFNSMMGTSSPASIERQEGPSPQSSCPRFFGWLSSQVL